MKPIAAVLFDFYDTLFWRDRTTTTMALAAAAGITIDRERVEAITRAIDEEARSPQELAKGRDLSAEAHRRCWTSLLRPLDALTPRLDPPLSQRAYDDACSGTSHQLFPDTLRCIEKLAAMGIPIDMVNDIG